MDNSFLLEFILAMYRLLHNLNTLFGATLIIGLLLMILLIVVGLRDKEEDEEFNMNEEGGRTASS